MTFQPQTRQSDEPNGNDTFEPSSTNTSSDIKEVEGGKGSDIDNSIPEGASARTTLSFDELLNLPLGDAFQEDADQDISSSIQQAMDRRDWDAKSLARVRQEENAGFYYKSRPMSPFIGKGDGNLYRSSVRLYRGYPSAEDILHESAGRTSYGTPLIAIKPSPLRKTKSISDIMETSGRQQWSESGVNVDDDDEDSWLTDSESGKYEDKTLPSLGKLLEARPANAVREESGIIADFDSIEDDDDKGTTNQELEAPFLGDVVGLGAGGDKSLDDYTEKVQSGNGNTFMNIFERIEGNQDRSADELRVSNSNPPEAKALPQLSGFFDSEDTSEVSEEPSTPESAQELELMTDMPVDELERERKLDDLYQRVMTEALAPSEELHIKRQILAYSQAVLNEDNPRKDIGTNAGMSQDPRIVGTWAAAAAHLYRSQRDQALYERDSWYNEAERLREAHYEQETLTESWKARAETWMNAAKMHQQSYETIREKGMLWIRREESIQRGDGIRHAETQTDGVDLLLTETQTTTIDEPPAEGLDPEVPKMKGDLSDDTMESSSATEAMPSEGSNRTIEPRAQIEDETEPSLRKLEVNEIVWTELQEKTKLLTNDKDELTRQIEDLEKKNELLSHELYLAQTASEKSQRDGKSSTNSPIVANLPSKSTLETEGLSILLQRSPRWIERERRMRSTKQFEYDRGAIMKLVQRNGTAWLDNDGDGS